MKISISFKNVKHGPSIDGKIEEKSKKLEKYLGGKTSMNWTFYSKEGLHYADVQLHGPTFDYHAQANSGNMIKTLDKALNKIEKQLQRQKDKWRSKTSRHFRDNQEMEILEPEVAWTDYDEDSFDDVA